jgi:hypothetical protein
MVRNDLAWTVRGFAGHKRIWCRDVPRRIAQERAPTARSGVARDKGRDPPLQVGRAPARSGLARPMKIEKANIRWTADSQGSGARHAGAHP